MEERLALVVADNGLAEVEQLGAVLCDEVEREAGDAACAAQEEELLVLERRSLLVQVREFGGREPDAGSEEGEVLLPRSLSREVVVLGVEILVDDDEDHEGNAEPGHGRTGLVAREEDFNGGDVRGEHGLAGRTVRAENELAEELVLGNIELALFLGRESSVEGREVLGQVVAKDADEIEGIVLGR